MTSAPRGSSVSLGTIEADLVLACVSASTNLSVPEKLPRTDTIDWNLVAKIAGRHGVMPLVYNALKNQPEVPPEAIARLRRDFTANSLSTTFLNRELVRLTKLFQDAGIRTVALKGPVLAKAAYGDVTMRQFSDLDILVPRASVAQIADVLIRERYLPRRYRAEAPIESLRRYFEDEFIRENGTQLVDLHWELTPRHFPYGPQADEVLRRAERFELDGADLLVASARDLMLFLCVHGAKHGWVCLGWVVDLARMLGTNPDLDPELLIAEARRTACLRMLLLGMTLARNLAGATLPNPIARVCNAESPIAHLATQVAIQMFSKLDVRPGLFAEWGVPLRTIDRRPEQAKFVVRRAFYPTIEDCEFLSLPDALYPLYYFLRPLRLAFQQGRRLFHDVPMVAPFRPRRSQP